MTLDRRTYISASGILDATGALTLQVGPVPLNTRWAVERVATMGGGAANPLLTVYRNAIADSNYIDGTPSTTGNRDVADENSPLYFEEGEVIVLRYTGGTVGAQVTVNLQYRQSPIHEARRGVHRQRAIPGGAVAQWEAGRPHPRPRGQHPTAVS